MSRPLKICLCDLTHDSIILVSDTIPINIGFVGSYAKQQFGDAVRVSLYKYPAVALAAIKADPPDILGLSNYSWNSNLSERVAAAARAANPAAVVVQGGTNFPHDDALRIEFLLRRPATDAHIEYEGEVAFANLVRRVLDAREGGRTVFDAPIEGIIFIEPSTRGSASPTLVKTQAPARLRNLDVIPSPYLNGMLEHFFDGRLTPFIETNRGCPFRCSFCHTGADYFQKMNSFSIERVREEIFYIAPRAAQLKVSNLHIADTNFGMFPRDREICEALYETQQKFDWPRQVMATTGKNAKERVIEITGILGKMFSVNMSVQSMDKGVLENIRRSNIKLEHYIDINKHLSEAGRSTKAELIIGLPGETRESFVNGVEAVIESGASSVTIYTLMLLNGTEFKEPDYRRRFGIEGRFRIVPLNFGDYDGGRVLDYEEVCVRTNTMSFADYLFLRGFALIVESIHNGRPFEELFRYALSLGIKRATLLRRLYESLARAPETIRALYADFMAETEGELWASEDELLEHYKDEVNFQRLRRGEVGGNLIYKYKSKSVAFQAGDWIRYLVAELRMLAGERLQDDALAVAGTEIDTISAFCQARIEGLLNSRGNTEPVTLLLRHDVPAWLRSPEGTALSTFQFNQPRAYRFYYTDEQLRTREDQFRRYGTDVNALSKIVTRISNLESLFRNVEGADGTEELFADTDVDRYTRYTLAH
ncbi:MAG: radical SAM protein [Betaproteobacteria bacterium]|nr:radical SAM protein [Betaproteobacteria bacterium]